jgi:uncharacterized ferritin-like protein (DUF455 family)
MTFTEYSISEDRAAAEVSKACARTRTYYTVEQNAAIFTAYFSLEFELFSSLAGYIPSVPELSVKCDLSYHLHSGMLRAKAFRERLGDFLISSPEHKTPAEWKNFVRHLLTAPNPAALFGALYRVVRPAQRMAYRLHAETTLQVNDAPSRDLLEMCLPGLEREIEWGEALLNRCAQAGQESDAAFEAEIREHLRALGGPMGQNRPPDAPATAKYPAFKKAKEMELEERFAIRSADRYTLPDWPEYEAIPSAYTHFTELPVIDICATIVYDGRALKLPFEFFADFTRQLWDECRHCRMGFERLQAFGVDPYSVPIPVGHYSVWANLGLLHRIASLTQVGEACSFQPKRQWVRAAWDRQDPFSALEHEYDIVDERTHVKFGKRWIPEIMKLTKDERTVKDVVQDADWEFREKINRLRKRRKEAWAKDLGQRFMGCGTDTSPVSLAPALDGIPNIIA